MKIKGKCEKINPMAALCTVLGLLVVSVPFRMYQLLNIIEEDTGFYKSVDWSVYVMYAVCALAIIVPYALTLLAKNIPASKSPYRKSKFLAAAAILFAGGIIADVVSSLSLFLINVRSFSAVNLSVLGTLNQGQIPLLIESVFGILAAIYIIIFGISYIDGRTTYSQYKFLAITPLFWAMSRIVLRFLRKIAYINVSDLMLEIFMLAFMMIFLLAFARISSELSSAKAMRSAFASGAVAAFFAATANIPRLLMFVTANGAKLPDEYTLSLCDLTFALFVVAYTVNAVKCASQNDSAELTAESEPKKTAEPETDDNFLSE